MTYHIRVRPTALMLSEEKVLLVKYDQDGIHYNLPGGGAEPGETMIEAVKREVQEEANAEVEVGPLAFCYERAPHKQSGDYPNCEHTLYLIFECTLKTNSVPKLPEFPDPYQVAVEWVSLDELDDMLLLPNIKNEIKQYVKSKRNIELIEDYKLKRYFE